ncbi:MAG: NAD(P)H-hydrate dehydratase [Betaproteobacteria bacterium]|nr:NAD(P)H-hydrate dehydratase [Betaproteobacteria bacterium]
MHNAPLYRAAGLRNLEAAASDQPLMQRAGLAAADLACTLLHDSQRPLLILAGPGNNGGDGFEAGMHLLQRFCDVRLVFAGEAPKLPADAAAARQRFLAAGGCELTTIPKEENWGLIIDALFGIGLQRDLTGHFAELVAAANALAACNACPLLALDCPSGLDADTGAVRGVAIRASHTITFIAAKPGLLTADGPDHCGELQTASLDLEAAALVAPDGESVARSHFANLLRPRLRNSHKGSNGSAGILGGACSMVGAAFLAGRAALQLGSGRVYLGLIDPNAPSFDPVQPELMLRSASTLLATPLTALACGPGMGTDSAQIAQLETAAALDLPLLLDADALNLLASEGNLEIAIATRKATTLLTPHPAEAARLLDCDVADIQADRIAAACAIAAQFNAHVALKACGTVLATPDGRWRINTTGNPGMGSAGMGDVLSGIVVALLAQGWPAESALAAGVHLHGAAADLLATNGGNITSAIGLTASETIPAARHLLNQWVANND